MCNSPPPLLFILMISEQGLTINDFRSIVELIVFFYSQFLHKSKIVNLYS